MAFVSPIKYDFYRRIMPTMIEKYPEVFNPSFPSPLAVGIHKQLKEREPDYTSAEISCLLWIWTMRWEYKCMAMSVNNRIDLDGNVTSITDEHREGFVDYFKRLSNQQIRRFNKRFLKQFGRPAFLSVPISMRKDNAKDGEETEATKETAAEVCS